MVKALAMVSPDDRAYKLMEPSLRDMGAYLRGEYSLFTPLPEAVLQEERQKKQEQKQKEKESAGKHTEEPAGSLAAAAKALSRKKKPAPQEDKEGQQLTLDMFGLLSDPATPSVPEMEQTQAEPAAPETAAATEPDVPEAAANTEPENPAARYDLGYGHLGNGLTVWNRLEEVHGDYKTVAHIDPTAP